MSWILTHLYDVTKDPEHLRKAIEIWYKEIDSASKLDMFSRVAELYWEIAKAHDLLGEHIDATVNFERASENYVEAADKIPQLKGFYQDYASYMRAWGEFERAKRCHAEKKYTQAKEHYEKVAEIYRSTERWDYLAPNYSAWARLEEAEDCSRGEQIEKSIELFRKAINLFEEAKRAKEIKLGKLQERSRDALDLIQQASDLAEEAEGSVEVETDKMLEAEEELLVVLIEASDIRRDYCRGRIALEEAKILDRHGEKLVSSRRFGTAAEIFQGIAETSEETSKEMHPLIHLCRAWQKMTQAESEASPELYLEASQLFDKARDQCRDERSIRLALGHSQFCRALEAGARFEDTRDLALHSEATQCLGRAASHYLRAGFKGASEYVRATQRLFDAYVYMDNAIRETDPQEKARFYSIAERLLESSAGSYSEAKYLEKSEEVERLLGRVREERSMAASLCELLHASPIVSTTEAFTAPMPTKERAVGLERFEDADIHAKLIISDFEVNVGEEISLEIELANAGKGPARLMRVEEIIPKGFVVSWAPEAYKVEDSHINMKESTLPPLKAEEVRLVLKPLEKGIFHLKPRIIYLDKAGRQKTHEPKSTTITVKELGISGWLRGPRRKK